MSGSPPAIEARGVSHRFRGRDVATWTRSIGSICAVPPGELVAIARAERLRQVDAAAHHQRADLRRRGGRCSLAGVAPAAARGSPGHRLAGPGRRTAAVAERGRERGAAGRVGRRRAQPCEPGAVAEILARGRARGQRAAVSARAVWVGCVSEQRWPARWSPSRRFCSWTSRSPAWTRLTRERLGDLLLDVRADPPPDDVAGDPQRRGGGAAGRSRARVVAAPGPDGGRRADRSAASAPLRSDRASARWSRR